MGFRPDRSVRLVKEHIPSAFITVHGYGKEVHLATLLYPTPDGNAPELSVDCDEKKFTLSIGGKEYSFDRGAEFLTTHKL